MNAYKGSGNGQKVRPNRQTWCSNFSLQYTQVVPLDANVWGRGWGNTECRVCGVFSSELIARHCRAAIWTHRSGAFPQDLRRQGLCHAGAMQDRRCRALNAARPARRPAERRGGLLSGLCAAGPSEFRGKGQKKSAGLRRRLWWPPWRVSSPLSPRFSTGTGLG